MPDRYALVIGVSQYQEEGLPAAAFADTDAQALARALEGLGLPRERITLLAGSQATKTAIDSRLRKLPTSAAAGQELIVFWSGLAFGEAGKGRLACYDSQPDDLGETSVPLARLLEALAKTRCARLVLLLDPRAGLGGEPLPHGELESFVASPPAWACFLSCSPGEASAVSGSLKAGIWAHHLTEALAGKAPRALIDHHLTAGSLQAHLEAEVPRTLRATFREAPSLTPVLYTSGPACLIADLGAALPADTPTADPRLQPLRRGSLRSESTSRVKALAGYRKFHRLPDRVSPGSRKFVADLTAEDVKADVDQVYASIRENMGYKRRDVEGSADRNTGLVRTPDFEYSVRAELADDDPTVVVWRREVAGITNPQLVLGKPFQQAFGEVFDTLVFPFTRPFDLEAWVDHLEEEPPANVKLRCASDCSSCDVVVGGATGVIRLFRDRVEIHGHRAPSSRGLVEAFLRFQDLFAGRRDLQELPLLEERK